MQSSSLASKIQEVEDLFYSDRLKEAETVLDQIRVGKIEGEFDPQECQKCNLEKFLNGELVTTLRSDMKILDKYFESFEEIDEWTLVKNKGKIKTWCKKDPGCAALMLAAEGSIESSMFNPLAIFAEVDLFKNWIPKLDYVRELTKVTNFRRILHYSFKMPLIIANRDFVCSAVGNIDKKRKAVVFTLNTVQSGTYFGIPIPGPGKCVRVDMKLGCVGFQYLNEKECRFRIMLQVDPRLKLVPMVLINYGTKIVLFELVRILNEMSMNLDEVYKKRIKENKDGLYKLIQERLSQLLDEDIKVPFLE